MVRAELLKIAGLPSVWVAAAIGLFAPALLGVVNLRAPGTDPDAGYLELTVGVVGALVLGVVTAGSEYRGRQITTSLVCVPSRVRLLAAKTAALALTVAVVAVPASIASLAVAGTLSAGAVPRIAGVTAYWVLSALLAYGITLVVRSGVLPLTVLILNSSVVSVTYLLTRVTPWATYLPDLAGAHLFIRETNAPIELGAVTGGLVMAGWTAAVLAVATVVFRRRDA
ncbi:hypothetical protein AFR_20920 [Actinoplanes friuliensis DSM 7358]|uniref:Uncharacterized protein n=1 Tax=Actinoplanes friuliensis DSM 7358 TaxID=1246995 RepID=U5W3E4_9ACTN|nr:hypothetical protein AFR_20920 [Actinoplanes friuliensis DSM 7358]